MMKTGHRSLLRIRAGLFALALAAILAPGGLAALDFKFKVVDPATGDVVPDASVVIIEARKRYTSDAGGIVNATVPNPGFYTVRIIAGARFRQLRVNISSGGRTITLTLAEPVQKKPAQKQTSSSGLVVESSKRKTKLSRYRIRIDEVKRIPGSFGEAIRGLETLPGVTAPSFGNGDIIVRGANPNANFYLLDDLPIGYAFHFFGLNSVIHNDLISAIDIYTGAYPVNYGDATGGIIAIETIDEVKRFGGHASFSLWSANMMLKGKLWGDSGYYMFAGRGSYMQHTLGQYFPDGIRPPLYGDAQFKLHYQISPKHSLYFYALGAKDSFAAAVNRAPSWDPTSDPDPIFIGASIALDQAFHTEGLRYIFRPGTRLINTSTVYYHNNIFYIDGTLGIIDAKVKQEDGWAAFKNVTNWEVVKKHVFVDVGVEARAFRYRSTGTTVRPIDPNDPSPDLYDTTSPDFESIPVSDSSTSSYSSGYAMVTLRGAGFEFKPGVRLDYFGPTKQTVVDPRGTVSYTFKSKTTLIGGAGVYHRTPDPNEYSPTTGNPNLRLERAEHYGGGIEQILGKWTFKVEVYRHYFTDIVVTDPYITTPYRINQDPTVRRYEEPILYNDRLGHSNDGTGFSEGYEVYIKKSNPPGKLGWYGWISYSWSRSIRNNHQNRVSDEQQNSAFTADELRILNLYDNTKDHYADFDQTVIANFIFGYKFSPEWQVGVRWKYATSRPFTPVKGDDGGQISNSGRVIYDPVFEDDLKNTRRLKPYHRLDLRIDRFMNYTWGYGNFFVEILNLYLRDNPESVSFDRARPYSATNPEIQGGFGNLVAAGRRIPLFNVGIEVKF